MSLVDMMMLNLYIIIPLLLKEDVGGSILSYEISSLLDRNLVLAFSAFCLKNIYWKINK